MIITTMEPNNSITQFIFNIPQFPYDVQDPEILDTLTTKIEEAINENIQNLQQEEEESLPEEEAESLSGELGFLDAAFLAPTTAEEELPPSEEEEEEEEESLSEEEELSSAENPILQFLFQNDFAKIMNDIFPSIQNIILGINIYDKTKYEIFIQYITLLFIQQLYNQPITITGHNKAIELFTQYILSINPIEFFQYQLSQYIIKKLELNTKLIENISYDPNIQNIIYAIIHNTIINNTNKQNMINIITQYPDTNIIPYNLQDINDNIIPYILSNINNKILMSKIIDEYAKHNHVTIYYLQFKHKDQIFKIVIEQQLTTTPIKYRITLLPESIKMNISSILSNPNSDNIQQFLELLDKY